ncbi:putative esterase [Nocardia brasiliensis NBRC 14402]|uniref:alpha/beta hydrolase family protein n=1 Tax=Nocardia brasiliensis TaxID=37326 RepID=UPI00045D42A4|nr:acetylhydrolase [Nocardia brasiliensis]ASF06613.1 alpha/beta hydrolase [Nocardia brasiliensis]GAJ84694.1 putative esterase [Nocardia brasiliensis NBRC 14402]SUB48233.1 Predicted dienelactone hydrolase [Nocardia brasiliensis]
MRSAVALVLALTATLAVAACSSGASDQPAAASATASATAAQPGRLPTPTGQFAIGRDVLQLVDPARDDPWTPGTPRELMVSMYYPARAGAGAFEPYASAAEIPALLRGSALDQEIPAETLSAVRTHSVAGARPVDGTYPLVVLSPGLTAPRYTLTALAEELTSRGYIVAAVDHAGESFGTEFPAGRLSTCVVCQRIEAGLPLSAVVETRARDVTFLLDRLTGAQPSWTRARMIDTARIGMAGHSLGGAAAAATMAADPRVRAGVNMDGSFFDDTAATRLGDRPFLLFGTDAETRPGGHDSSWDRAWIALRGWKRWLTVVGADHNSFLDTPALLGADAAATPALPGHRAVEIIRAYIVAFFDQHLRALPQPLLDGADPAFPEIRSYTP